MAGTPLRILAQTAYPPAVASARVRLQAFSRFLAPHGIALDYRPALTDGQYRLLASDAPPSRKARALLASASMAIRDCPEHDALLVHRLRLLGPLPGFDPPRHLDAYDFDDALFLGSAAPVNRRFAWAKREATRCLAYVRRARLVIAGNAFLASAAAEHARTVEVVPSCVDPDRQPLHSHEHAGLPTIGWIGSPTTSFYLKPIIPAVAALNERAPRARLLVVGADTGLRFPWIEHRPWSLDREPYDLAEFDVGMMPLPDTDWARGKCGYKLLQYFAAGVPAVSSPVGVATELVGSDRGLLASSPEEWRACLEQLLGNTAERRERGSAARAFAEREYSYRKWAPRLGELLRSLAV